MKTLYRNSIEKLNKLKNIFQNTLNILNQSFKIFEMNQNNEYKKCPICGTDDWMERNDENGNSIVCKMCYFSYSK